MTMLMIRTALVGMMIVNLLGLTGCLSAIREVGGKALEDRAHADLTKDTELESYLNSQLLQQYKGKDQSVKFDVWEQRVLVTGTVGDPALKTDIGTLVKKAPNVRQDYNEIQVVPPGVNTEPPQGQQQETKQTEESGMQETIDDVWISKKIEAQLLADSGVHSINYRWRVVRSTVYIIGRARTQAELDRVLDLCRKTKGVTEVKHFIEVKPV